MDMFDHILSSRYISMRWILVFLFLYIIPLVVLFRNYNNFKRSLIYASTYIVVMTTIVITNIYISGLNYIKDIIYYQNYSFDNGNNEKSVSNFDNKDKVKETKNKEINEDKLQSNKNENEQSKDDIIKPEISDTTETKTEEIKNDKEIIVDFKKEIYEIETIALLPMRDCLPYTKNIAENLKHLSSIKEEIIYAQKKCIEVIDIYENMEIPQLSSKEYSYVLDSARQDVKKAYELREKAMEAAVNLVSTKNPKYIGKITNYLNLSDNQIENFKIRLNDLNEKIK